MSQILPEEEEERQSRLARHGLEVGGSLNCNENAIAMEHKAVLTP